MPANKVPPDDALVEDFASYKTMRQPLESVATVRNVSSASELLAIIQSPPFSDARWAFRGHGDTDWLLKASIERIATKPGIAEDYVEREFKRRAHHYLHDLPGDQEDLEWLALMQHYGAPTRLLDWTKSPYVAAFFAAECASPEKDFAIWAVDQDSVKAEALAMLGLNNPGDDTNLASRENFTRIYRDQQPANLYLVVPIQPYRMNERLTIQQGVFLCANNPVIGFRTCLKRLLDCAQKKGKMSGPWLYKLVVTRKARMGVLEILNRMNINSATLFPGLDGFARSLRIDTEIRDGENPLGFLPPA